MYDGGGFGRARVRSTRDVADGVRLIEVVPEVGARPYPPGAHLDLMVLIGEAPDVRSYSLVGDGPDDGAYRIAVKELSDSRGGSIYVRGLQPGATISVAEPQSHFELQYGRPEYLLIAGGIGITPIIGMSQALNRSGATLRVLYAAQTTGQLAFADELRELLGDRLREYVSSAGQRIDLAAEIDSLHQDAELYLCGPLRLREAAQDAWRNAGRTRECLRFETFASGGRFAPETFNVVLRDHGDRVISVARDRTMFDALHDAGIELLVDCLRGECGLCTVDVIDAGNQLDHRDVFLSATERSKGDRMCACVSRAVGGTITIDTGYREQESPTPASGD